MEIYTVYKIPTRTANPNVMKRGREFRARLNYINLSRDGTTRAIQPSKIPPTELETQFSPGLYR